MEPPVKAAQQRPAACQGNTVRHQVGDQFWWRNLDGRANSIDDGVDGAAEGVTQLDTADLYRFGQARREVAAANGDGGLAIDGKGRSCRDLDLLGAALADQEIMYLTGVGDDVLVHLVTGCAD